MLVTREQALKDFGCDPTKFAESEYKAGSIFCYLELHIEQCPILDLANKSIGVVSGISGPLWLTVKLKGMSGHTGSVPMQMHRDSLVSAAEQILSNVREQSQFNSGYLMPDNKKFMYQVLMEI